MRLQPWGTSRRQYRFPDLPGSASLRGDSQGVRPGLAEENGYHNELASEFGRLNERQPLPGGGWLKSKPTEWNTCKGIPLGRFFSFGR